MNNPQKPNEQETSYCAIHKTYPQGEEPCWQCVNKYIQQGFQEGYKESAKDIRQLITNIIKMPDVSQKS